MTQMDFWEQARTMARTTDIETSHEAAVIALPNARTNRLKALEALGYFGGLTGLTDFELANITGIQQTSIGKRRGELRDAGYVEALELDGVKVRRLSPTGAPAQVWRITQEGLDLLNAGGVP